MFLKNTIDVWGLSFGAAPLLLLIGCCCIIFIFYRTSVITFLVARTKPSVSASEDASSEPPQHQLADLSDFCRSNSLSEHALRQRLSSCVHEVEDSLYYFLLFDICRNGHLTLETLQCFIEFFPRAVCAVDEMGRTPLHLVYMNKNVTLDIFVLD